MVFELKLCSCRLSIIKCFLWYKSALKSIVHWKNPIIKKINILIFICKIKTLGKHYYFRQLFLQLHCTFFHTHCTWDRKEVARKAMQFIVWLFYFFFFFFFLKSKTSYSKKLIMAVASTRSDSCESHYGT